MTKKPSFSESEPGNLLTLEEFLDGGYGNLQLFLSSSRDAIHEQRVASGEYDPQDPFDKAYDCLVRAKTEHPDLVQKIQKIRDTEKRLNNFSPPALRDVPLSHPDYEQYAEKARKQRQVFEREELLIPMYGIYKILKSYDAPDKGISTDVPAQRRKR
ncbi:hypothetical protein HYT51_02280 [Candidatus Woesearchaeota archaeon]|nr:hypothetical protein [Candidatus Woesearchaeota archaeon]